MLPQRAAQLSERTLGVFSSLLRAGLPHLLLSILSLQGLNYLAQLVMARLLTPAEFGLVRSVEVDLALLALLASAGMPSLAVTCIAEADPAIRGRLIGRLALVGTLSGLAVAAATTLFLHFRGGATTSYHVLLVWSIALMACSRTCLNYFQGTKQLRHISLLISAVSAAALAVTTIAVWSLGLRGWVAGRYLAEGLFVGLSLWALRGIVRFRGPLPSAYSYARLASLGSTLSLSVVIRTALDNLGILALSRSHVSQEAIGYYGLAAILTTIALIVPGAIANLAIPRLAERRFTPGAARELFLRVSRSSVLSLSVVAGLAVASGPTLINALLPSYRPATPVFQLLLLSLPLRALVSLSGAVFMAYGRNLWSVAINLALLILAATSSVWLVPRFGALGAASISLSTEVLGAGAYAFGALHVMKGQAARGALA